MANPNSGEWHVPRDQWGVGMLSSSLGAFSTLAGLSTDLKGREGGEVRGR